MKVEYSKLYPVLAGIHIVALPLYRQLPPLIIATTALFTLWTVLLIQRRARPPGRFLLILLAALVVGVLLQSYGTIFGQQPGSAMLLLLSFLKIFEMKGTRDIAIVIFMGMFLTASNFFFSQSLWIAIYVIAVVIYLTSLLLIFSDRVGSTGFLERLRLSTRIVALALPMMLILFVLFPRVPGPLWGLPKDSVGSKVGMSEDMTPGSINRLISSAEVAFRVRFFRDPPPKPNLYWRGLVLSNYDGKTWRREDAPSWAYPLLYDSGKEQSKYQYYISLEPHNERWLYSLDQVYEHEDVIRIDRQMQLFTRDRVTDVFAYVLRSDLNARNMGLFDKEREKNLELPEGFNPRTRRFADRLAEAAGGDPGRYVQSVLNHFREQPFVYTLSPSLLGRDAMDEFLFETRRGFCEHYSSAFVTLMRAGGVPARVVIGYQGGNMNPLDNYMIVRQSDAHAWAEIWLEERGWVRVDPTAAVSPDRIERGIENAGLERELLPAALMMDNALYQRARWMWDSFHNNWNRWVVGFNQQRQKYLFRLLGFDNVDAGDLVLYLVIAMTLAGVPIAWWVIYRQPGTRIDTAKRYYERFCGKLARAGLARDPHEGPREYLSRVQRAMPARADTAADVVASYVRIRYGNAGDDSALAELKSQVRRFRAVKVK